LVELDGSTIYHSYLDSVRIALFELAAPAVPGCRVTLERSISRRASAQWSIGFKGASASGRTGVRTTLGAAFSVDAGQRKHIFVDVPVEISRVFEIKESILRPTDLVFVSGSSERPSTILVPGAELIPGSEPQRRRGSRLLPPFPLAGDSTRAVTPFNLEREYSGEVILGLGASVKGVDVGATASVGVTAVLKLTFALVAGHDYELYATEDGLGITWIVT
jgi:hypothetical protein